MARAETLSKEQLITTIESASQLCFELQRYMYARNNSDMGQEGSARSTTHDEVASLRNASRVDRIAVTLKQITASTRDSRLAAIANECHEKAEEMVMATITINEVNELAFMVNSLLMMAKTVGQGSSKTTDSNRAANPLVPRRPSESDSSHVWGRGGAQLEPFMNDSKNIVGVILWLVLSGCAFLVSLLTILGNDSIPVFAHTITVIALVWNCVIVLVLLKREKKGIKPASSSADLDRSVQRRPSVELSTASANFVGLPDIPETPGVMVPAQRRGSNRPPAVIVEPDPSDRSAGSASTSRNLPSPNVALSSPVNENSASVPHSIGGVRVESRNNSVANMFSSIGLQGASVVDEFGNADGHTVENDEYIGTLRCTLPVNNPVNFVLSARVFLSQLVVIGFDENNKIIMWNQCARQHTGIPLAEATGQTIDLFFADPGVGQKLRNTITQMNMANSIWTRTPPTNVTLLCQGASKDVHISAIITPMFDDAAVVGHALVGYVKSEMAEDHVELLQQYRSEEMRRALVAQQPSQKTWIGALVDTLDRKALQASLQHIQHWALTSAAQLVSVLVGRHTLNIRLHIDENIAQARFMVHRRMFYTIVEAFAEGLSEPMEVHVSLQETWPTVPQSVTLVFDPVPQEIFGKDLTERFSRELRFLFATLERIGTSGLRLSFPCIRDDFVGMFRGGGSIFGGSQKSIGSMFSGSSDARLNLLVFEPSRIMQQHVLRTAWQMGHTVQAFDNLRKFIQAVDRGVLNGVEALLAGGSRAIQQEVIELMQQSSGAAGIDLILMGEHVPATENDTTYLVTPVNRNRLKPITEMLLQKRKKRLNKEQQVQQRRQLFQRHNAAPWVRGKLLGRGAFGDVFEATDTATQGMFAVKIIPLTSLTAPMVDMLLTEIDVMSSLSHPNIVHYFHCERAVNSINIFMEKCDRSLVYFLNKRTKPEHIVSRLPAFMRDILSGTAFMHSKGIVHCDLKPQNVLYKHDQCKIADFGTAKVLSAGNAGLLVGDGGGGDGDDPQAHIEGSGTAIDVAQPLQGTLQYMAPETLTGVHGTTTASDIWSIGIICAQLAGVFLPHLNGEVNPASLTNFFMTHTSINVEHTSNELQQFVAACLQVDPSKRPTADTLLAHPFVVGAIAIETLPDSVPIVNLGALSEVSGNSDKNNFYGSLTSE